MIPFNKKGTPQEHHAEERPTGLQLLISQAVISNCRVGAKCSQVDILNDLQSFISSRHYADMSCYPNEKSDYSPYSNATWLNDYSVNCDQLQNLTRRDKDLYSRLKRDKNLPHHIWCVWCDQLWMEFVGVEKANERPITFIDAFPVRLWICQEVPYTIVEEGRAISPISTNSSVEAAESASETDELGSSPRSHRHKKVSVNSTESENQTLLQVSASPALRPSHSDSDLNDIPRNESFPRHATSANTLATDTYAWGGPPPPYGGNKNPSISNSMNSLPPAYDSITDEDPGEISKPPLEDGIGLDVETGVNQMTPTMAMLVNAEKTVQIQLEHFQLLSLLRIAEEAGSMMERIDLDNKQREGERSTTEILEEDSMILNVSVPNVLVDLILPPCIGIDPIQRLSLKERVEYEKERKNKPTTDSPTNTTNLLVSSDAYVLPMRSRGKSTSAMNSSPMSQSLAGTPTLSDNRKLSNLSFSETSSQISDEYETEQRFKEVKDVQVQAGDSLVNANLKPSGENQLISVLRIHAENINIGIQAKGKDSVVKVSSDRLNLNELGNMKYGRVLDPRGCIIEEKEADKQNIRMSSLTGDAMVKLRLVTGPKAELFAKDGDTLGFADIRINSLAAALLMSTVDNLSEFSEDEYVQPTMPFRVRIENSDISLYDDKARRSRAAIKLPPSHMMISDLLVERNSDGVVILNKKQQPRNEETDTSQHQHNTNLTTDFEGASANSTLITDSINQQVEALIGENGRLVEDLKVVNGKVNGLHAERESLLKVIDKLQKELMNSNRDNDDLQKRFRSLSISRR